MGGERGWSGKVDRETEGEGEKNGGGGWEHEWGEYLSGVCEQKGGEGGTGPEELI